MAGVLLYTASPDSEGTLGGLAALADLGRLAATFQDAHIRSGLCSTCPMCAVHDADESLDTLHNAVCRACMFVPKTSCEHSSHNLDRATIVPTLNTTDLAHITYGEWLVEKDWLQAGKQPAAIQLSYCNMVVMKGGKP